MDVVSRRGFLLNQIDGPVDAIIADGTDNQRGACAAVTERRRLQWWSFFSFTRKAGAATESQPTQRDRYLLVAPISGDGVEDQFTLQPTRCRGSLLRQLHPRDR